MNRDWETVIETYIRQFTITAQEYDLEVVVYDESEYFPEFNDKKFDYPFTERKSLLTSFKIRPSDLMRLDNADYMFT
jgi:uncharacterized protein YprB with RNaseH-like and TPR domain